MSDEIILGSFEAGKADLQFKCEWGGVPEGRGFLHVKALNEMADRQRHPAPPDCPYCGKQSKKVTGQEMYPGRPDLAKLRFFRCEQCGASVGCHSNTGLPLGRLATKELRRARVAAHKAFDPIWESRSMTRTEAYAWLADALGMPKEECHFGWFDEATCRKAIEACRSKHEVGELPF